jgi:hypothetical protein
MYTYHDTYHDLYTTTVADSVDLVWMEVALYKELPCHAH